jgi:hypothetical protein
MPDLVEQHVLIGFYDPDVWFQTMFGNPCGAH